MVGKQEWLLTRKNRTPNLGAKLVTTEAVLHRYNAEQRGTEGASQGLLQLIPGRKYGVLLTRL